MSVSGKTARRSLPYLETTDPPVVHEALKLLAEKLDNDAETGQGTLAERPAAALRGRIWVVQGDSTEANNGVVWWDTGSTWIALATPFVVGSTLVNFGSGEWKSGETRNAAMTLTGVGFKPRLVTAVTTEGGNIEFAAYIAGTYGYEVGKCKVSACILDPAANGGGTMEIAWVAYR